MSFKTKTKFKQKWKSVLAFLGIGALTVGTIVGTGVGAANYAYKNKKTGDFGDKISARTQVLLNDYQTEEEQIDLLKTTANLNQKHLQALGVNNVSAKYGIYQRINKNTKKWEKFGEIVYEFYPTNSKLDIVNFLTKTKPYEQISSKIQLISLFTTANRLELQNISSLLSPKPELSQNKEFDDTNWLTLNSDAKKIEIKTTNEGQQVEVSLPKTSADDQKFDLNFFAKEFDANFNYSASSGKTRAQTVAAFEKTKQNRKAPVNSWLLWVNRDGLIARFNMLLTLAHAQKQKYVDAKSWDYVDATYKNLNVNGEEKAFIDWLATQDFDKYFIHNSSIIKPINVQVDQLLNIIRAFYQSSSHKVKTKDANNKDVAQTFKDNEMFYSWNINKLSLINGFVYAIDYNNFFNYFEAPKKDDKLTLAQQSIVKYTSNKLVLNQKNTSRAFINTVYNLKQYYLPTYFAQAIYSENDIKKDYAKTFYSLLNNFSTKLPNLKQGAIKMLDPIDAILIGIAVLILIVAIIISVLYKVPGLIHSLLMAFNFVISLLLIKASNLGFSTETYGALIISVCWPLLNLVNFNNHIKRLVEQKYSYKNALRISLNKTIINQGMFYLLMIFISLVFMYFGKNNISIFGFNLILITFSCLLISYILFIAMMYLLWLIAHHVPKIHLWRQYLAATNAISQNRFNEEFDWNDQQKYQQFIFKAMNQKVYKLSFLIFVFVIGLAGLFVLGFVVPNMSFSFGSVYELTMKNDLKNFNEHEFSSFLDYEINNGIVSMYFDAKNPSALNEIASISLNNRFSDAIVYTSSLYNLINNITNSIAAYFIIFAIIVIWSSIWLKPQSTIPLIINLICTTLVSFGIAGLFRLFNNQASIIAINTSFVLIVSFSLHICLNLKQTLNLAKVLTKKQLQLQIQDSLIKYFNTYNIIYIVMLFTLLWLMIFAPLALISFNAIILFSLMFTHYLAIIIINYLWMLTMILYERLLAKTLAKSDNANNVYDKFDEQEIVNINKF
ncbi:putative membrane protein [Ureaplasma urealyticum serovar 10 str. ATCC 33699]|uniref:Putative membrane protein n=1 Tax=Ureaplasma urealyticum serovar 10 (strain ATCC 33699 / Western) TaxID=565575 RepID=B5ZBZ5_UREU1|nr:membrane protein [Ureaplasma urealyticum]ACI59742.1 putative membrane protein [Ureaplasma urealyticum serovar 10 str. ATCC 33699]